MFERAIVQAQETSPHPPAVEVMGNFSPSKEAEHVQEQQPQELSFLDKMCLEMMEGIVEPQDQSNLNVIPDPPADDEFGAMDSGGDSDSSSEASSSPKVVAPCKTQLPESIQEAMFVPPEGFGPDHLIRKMGTKSGVNCAHCQCFSLSDSILSKKVQSIFSRS